MGSRFFRRVLFVVVALCATSIPLSSPLGAQVSQIRSSLPEAPSPQFDETDGESLDGRSPLAQSSSTPQSSTSDPSQQNDRQKAAEEIKEQEHQRVLGIVPMFNTTYRNDAVSLTRKQKISLAFHSATDPVTFATAFVVAGLHEALDDDPGFGWGPEGYFKRSGAAYLDAFDGTMIGNGILPSMLHQDPRFFRLGHGTMRHRLLYAMATTVICKHDNTRKWEPNYSNIIGNISSGALSNLYYPSSNSGFGQTISNGMIVTAEGTIGSIFQEFWPDVSRKLFHKDPTHGLDAKAAQSDKNVQRPEETKNPKR